MNADSYFEIGHSHKVCEDYALSGVEGDLAYAIVSDGCSSSKNTDVGARLLAHIGRDALLYLQKRKLIYDRSFLKNSFRAAFEELIIKKCLEVKDTLRVPCDIFDATFLLAFAIGDSWKVLFSWGDGYFIIKRPDDSIEVITLSYDSNALYYISYELSLDKREAYKKEYGTKPLFKSFDAINSNGDVLNLMSETVPEIMKRSYFSILVEESSTISQIAVSSDGISTYEDDPRVLPPDGRALSKYRANDIIPTMVAYKNPVGEFVTRRMHRLKKDHANAHIIHQDDISCAAINFL